MIASSGHHFNQEPWIKYLICKEHGPWPTDFAARHCNNAAFGPKPTLVSTAAKVGYEPEMTNAALWTKVWFVRNRIKDNQSLAENDHLHASANTLL